MSKATSILASLAALAGLCAAATSLHAQAWPQKPIMFVVPFAPGGGTDAFARPLAAQLDNQLGQRVLIENKAGAGGTLGATYAFKQPNDGYTFLIGAAHHTIAPSIYPRLEYDIEKDFVPVIMLAQPPHVVTVNPGKVEAKTLKDFIAYTQKTQINYGSAGAGTTHHLAGEFFNSMAKTKLNHVPYRGAGPAMQDLLAGHVPVVFDGLGTSAPQIAAGNLRGLAITAPKRVKALPDVPTSAEAGLPGFEFATWYGILARKGTPQEAIDRMIKEVQAAMALPAIQSAWEKNGSEVPNVSGEAFAKVVSADVARWRKVVTEAGIKLE
ncbi:MAG: tripartite tricarboxylate transporter substrate binding protein [Xanthobacteraceae bacterium]|nr:tripartite tricarboxylate transporter substrate binding protein [Xanthobacteraceae bacterium]